MSGTYQEGQRIPFVLINLHNQNFSFDGQDAKILRQHKVNDGMNLHALMACLNQISPQTYQKFTDHGLAKLAQVLELTMLADQVMVKNVDLTAQKGFYKMKMDLADLLKIISSSYGTNYQDIQQDWQN